MSAGGIKPDIAGFATAQTRLRTELGRDVRLYGPAQISYDPLLSASAFDDEGFPLDPLASAVSSAPASVEIAGLTVLGVVRVNVVFQPLSAMRRDEVVESALAIRSRLNKDLIADIADMGLLSQATYFQVGTLARDDSGAVLVPEIWSADDDELWKIVNAKTDGFGGLQRYIVFGQGTH